MKTLSELISLSSIDESYKACSNRKVRLVEGAHGRLRIALWAQSHKCLNDRSWYREIWDKEILASSGDSSVVVFKSGSRSHEYHAWYFSYGTVSKSTFLTRLLSLPEAERPLLIPANISRGRIRTWQNKHNALVNGVPGDRKHGSADRVTTKEREEALLLYETEKYELVRCSIRMESGTFQGLAFRLAGSLSSL